jgi:3-hydroxyacyl-CoA dehydrogenase / enoyl-CoA hydratase / 3-hydroxybutyryl-CoA epimerase
MTDHKGFRAEFDAETGVATLWMQMAGRANKINGDFGEGFAAALEDALAFDGLKGIIVASGHRDFCVGADLDFVYAAREPGPLLEMVGQLNGLYRKLETAGVPVVAALTGSALGGGYEIALSCHYRVALDSPKVQLGLPEVNLGVIPGAGGTQRLPRLIGIQPSLEHIAQGKITRAPKALKAGLIDALATDVEALTAAAHQYIAEHPKAKQPWDNKAFQYPGGVQPDTPECRNLFAGGAAMLFKKTAGAYAAPEAAVRAVYEGTLLGMDAALQVEARYFVKCVVSDQAKDMIRTFWFHKSAVEKQEGLPQIEKARIQKVGVLGAGMMGAGLAVTSAHRGYDVVLKDINQEALDRGLAHCKKSIGKIARHQSSDEKQAILERITGTLDVNDLAGCDLIIEAVFENLELKHRVIKETEAVLGPDAIFASNTSALPIDDLAQASKNTANFIGMHYFSPVEKMPLLEVIKGAGTSEETLARVLNFARKTKKTSIVVNDGYGFYTTRFFTAYILESVELVAAGHDPVLVEWAARKAGQVISPLKVFDEVTLSLAVHGFEMGERYLDTWTETPGIQLVRKMAEMGRTGKAAKAGFYDYSKEPRSLWSGLAELVGDVTPETTGVDYLADRIMLAQVRVAADCMERGILQHPRDGEIGAIFGLGFSPASGGPFAWMDRRGIGNVVAALDALGAGYEPPKLLRDMAEKGETFFPQV